MYNMGMLDRLIRFIVAILLIVLYKFELIYGSFGITMVIIASVLLLTSIINHCPFYQLMHFTTRNSGMKGI